MFILCNFPQAILRIMNNHSYNQNAAFQIFRLVCNLTEFLNASVNFLIYFLCNRQIRKEVSRLLSNGSKQLTFKHKLKSNDFGKGVALKGNKQRTYEVIS